jgi:hypothetical protein
VTAQYQTANINLPNSSLWKNPTNFAAGTPSPSGSTDVPKTAITRNNSGGVDAMGARGRVTISCSAQNGVEVRVIACGRRLHP